MHPKRKAKPKMKTVYRCVAACLGLAACVETFYFLFVLSASNDAVSDTVAPFKIAPRRCAINLFGLPRAFKSLVLPSIVKNVIEPNPSCDYFVHYYYQTEESAGRSGQGGAINPNEMLLLKDHVSKDSIVEFAVDTEDDFWKKYHDLVETIRSTKVAETGKYLYFPWKARTYNHPVTTDNIVKMWHSIQSSWQLMEKTASDRNIRYTTVAMLRSDVVYVTPIDINDGGNNVTTIPSFGKHPISDRIIYGPAHAVKIWATERFSRLEQHVHHVQETDPGWGMHSERFLNFTILPAIEKVVEKIREHPTLCFFRARADESVWISDCEGPPHVSNPAIRKAFGDTDMPSIVARAIGRSCSGNVTRPKRSVKSLDCAIGAIV